MPELESMYLWRVLNICYVLEGHIRAFSLHNILSAFHISLY